MKAETRQDGGVLQSRHDESPMVLAMASRRSTNSKGDVEIKKGTRRIEMMRLVFDRKQTGVGWADTGKDVESGGWGGCTGGACGACSSSHSIREVDQADGWSRSKAVMDKR